MVCEMFSCLYPWTLNVATRGLLTHLENTKNHFRPGLRPRPRWGSSRRSPRPLSRLERGHFSPYAIPLDTDPPSALAIRPPRSPARSTPMCIKSTKRIYTALPALRTKLTPQKTVVPTLHTNRRIQDFLTGLHFFPNKVDDPF